ncbi:galactan beta-1,4-galactosyltransferase GALS3 [Nicotiana tabacum]|uniref:Glycosyltransferase family 92 protein n=1 Tax=Nicotiana tabacum TaxID=4097 RepID=A0A1S4AVL5_TOBAC|nr:galactan beta-1,4-galactosyltransferase GALS3-like [Nicotiana tomentosiformis]XP_016480620.1 PREDICTED: galactan beta-1,4-galactosyltransferase GALS3-like [Nicotiana tabacum]
MSTKEKERKMFVGVVWNCAAELKFLLTALLFLCSLITLLHFLPSRFYFSPSDLANSCLSTPVDHSLSHFNATNSSALPPPPPPPSSLDKDRLLENGVVKRAFNPFGSAAYNFILMSAYRGGYNTFAVMGLASKPLHVYGKPSYLCEWVPFNKNHNSISVTGHKILPDWGYGRVYTVLVINCTFPVPVGDDGGKLLIHAATNGGGDTKLNTTDTFEALTETGEDFINFTSTFKSPPKYDFLYCGSSLYGNLSPQRVREWLAFHVRLFGEKSHFVIHDAGGVHEGVMEVLKPWMDKGYVTLQDIRDQERFDGYYHNQFLIVNDCLHRYKFQAKWMFFFDVDEFIFVPKKSTIKSVVDSLADYTQFTIEQMPMSNKLCLSEDRGKSYRKWGFEKLVYKDVKRGIRRDRKYAVQPRNVIATGVHMSQNTVGKTTHKTEGRIKYFHYHGTIAERREPCRQLVNATSITVDGTPYIVDTTMRDIAATVKRFELKMIGSTLQRTRQ